MVKPTAEEILDGNVSFDRNDLRFILKALMAYEPRPKLRDEIARKLRVALKSGKDKELQPSRD